jgi:hypothetical protein
METTGTLENYVEIENQKIELKGAALLHMNEIRKWTQFLSILGFVVVGLLVAVGCILILASITKSSMQIDELGLAMGPLMGVFYILFAGIYFIPVLYMFRFSIFAKKSIMQISSGETSNELMAHAIVYLKKHFRYVGIFTITILVVYLLVIVGFLISNAII